MENYEWPANDYAIGNYIQAAFADQYLNRLIMDPSDHVLDIGCGDGSYSVKIIERVPDGSLLGIDRSANMLQVAHEKMENYPNVSLQQMDVLKMDYNRQFDRIVSFWCLQWCEDLTTAYMNIYRALKEGGGVFNIIPAGNDPLVRSFQWVKSSNKFPQLRHFKLPVDFERVGKLPNILAELPFKNAQAELEKSAILLPSLDIFRKFVNGLAFFHGQVPEDEISVLNEALVEAYDLECQQKHQGKYWFDLSMFLITAEK